ncbi:YciI family protein [Plantactinospora sp. GCM10030261]|uniref:YciI family protein n=1 Tax=Plantactinospora sp. GCM10030261 TaxID=3273420 RepID=UPI00361E4513
MVDTPRVDYALDTYECIVFYPGPAGRALRTETARRLQAEHSRYLDALRDRGVLLVAGAVDGRARHPDPPCGFGLSRTGSVDDVRMLVEADPAVRAGLYRVDVLTFLAPAGSLVFPAAPEG